MERRQLKRQKRQHGKSFVQVHQGLPGLRLSDRHQELDFWIQSLVLATESMRPPVRIAEGAGTAAR